MAAKVFEHGLWLIQMIEQIQMSPINSNQFKRSKTAISWFTWHGFYSNQSYSSDSVWSHIINHVQLVFDLQTCSNHIKWHGHGSRPDISKKKHCHFWGWISINIAQIPAKLLCPWGFHGSSSKDPRLGPQKIKVGNAQEARATFAHYLRFCWKNWGYPDLWMVYFMETLMKVDDLWWFRGTPMT